MMLSCCALDDTHGEISLDDTVLHKSLSPFEIKPYTFSTQTF